MGIRFSKWFRGMDLGVRRGEEEGKEGRGSGYGGGSFGGVVSVEGGGRLGWVLWLRNVRLA